MSTRIPDDLIADLCERTNAGARLGWPRYADRDGELWDLTDATHDGDRVMMPYAGDMRPMLRRDVVAEYGPLREAQR